MLLRASRQPLSPFVAAFSQHHQVLKYKIRAFELLKWSITNPKHYNRHVFYTTLKANSQLIMPCEDEMWGKCVRMNLHTSFSHMEINTRSPPASHSHWLYIFELVFDEKEDNLNLAITVNLVALKKIYIYIYFQCITAVFFSWTCVRKQCDAVGMFLSVFLQPWADSKCRINHWRKHQRSACQPASQAHTTFYLGHISLFRLSIWIHDSHTILTVSRTPLRASASLQRKGKTLWWWYT